MELGGSGRRGWVRRGAAFSIKQCDSKIRSTLKDTARHPAPLLQCMPPDFAATPPPPSPAGPAARLSASSASLRSVSRRSSRPTWPPAARRWERGRS